MMTCDIALTREGCHVALASRFLGKGAAGISWSRKLLLKAAVVYARWTTGLQLSDAPNGFQAFRAEAAPALRRLFVLFFFGTGLAFILYPGLTMGLAHLVGIGRGAELIFYPSIPLLLFPCFNFYIRFHLPEERLAQVARALALHHPLMEKGRGR